MNDWLYISNIVNISHLLYMYLDRLQLRLERLEAAPAPYAQSKDPRRQTDDLSPAVAVAGGVAAAAAAGIGAGAAAGAVPAPAFWGGRSPPPSSVAPSYRPPPQPQGQGQGQGQRAADTLARARSDPWARSAPPRSSPPRPSPPRPSPPRPSPPRPSPPRPSPRRDLRGDGAWPPSASASGSSCSFGQREQERERTAGGSRDETRGGGRSDGRGADTGLAGRKRDRPDFDISNYNYEKHKYIDEWTDEERVQILTHTTAARWKEIHAELRPFYNRPRVFNRRRGCVEAATAQVYIVVPPLSLSISIYIYIYISLSLSLSLPIYLSLTIYLSLSIYLSIYLSPL
jgi:hypothetical protein